MEAYIYILLLIAIASTCHGSCTACRNRASMECSRTWDNGRKKCCEGEGNRHERFGKYCRNGRFDLPPRFDFSISCSEVRAECQDSGSVESVESVEKTTRRPRNMGDENETMNINTNPSMPMYARGGSGGSCPGLEACVEACPAQVPKVYTVCVANCGRVCGNK